MITLDARIERHLPLLKKQVTFWVYSLYPYLSMYGHDIYQDVVVHVLLSRPTLEKVMGEKKNEAERNRVFFAYIQKTMERVVRDRIIFYKIIYSIPAHHKYEKTTPAFVPKKGYAVCMELDDTRVILKACSPTEDDLLLKVELSRAASRLSDDARVLLELLNAEYKRHKVLEIMGINLWRFRSLKDELRQELAYILN